MNTNVSPASSIEVQTYESWISRSEATDDAASLAAAARLAGLLDALSPGLDTPLFPLAHWLHFAPTAANSELGEDGHPRLGGFMPPLPLPRRMWAGSKIAFQSPIRAGQRLLRTTTIESITPKSGASGRLCFVVLRHDVSADGVPALTEHQTIVYRDAVHVDPSAPSPQKPPRRGSEPPQDDWEWAAAARPDEVMLFRYSALTYNSHRIHYDLPYATGVEGYPGLVVHAPLSATLMMDRFLRRNPDVIVSSFEFSVRAPLFVNEKVHVVGRTGEQMEAGDVEQLAVIAPGGGTAVTGLIVYKQLTEPV